MSAPKYTPGPWKPSMPHKAWDGTYSLFEIHWSDDGECVAEIVHGQANARLIAAAPELLEALEWVESTGMCEHGGGGDMIRAAIAKARGEA